MKVAVNTRFLLKGQLEGIGTFSHEVLQRICRKNPQHEFLFLFDRPFDKSFIYAKNCKGISLFPPARHPFLFVWWFEISIARALKKYDADVFFSPDGYLSLASKIPSIPVFHDLAFEHFPKDVPFLAAKHYQYFFPKYAAKASKILTVSQFSKNDISHQYGVDKDKISLVYNGASERFKPINLTEAQEKRNEYCNGSEYYLYVGALHQRKNITRLLKAYDDYSLSAKNPKKLLIVGRKAWGNSEMENFYNRMKAKENVIFTGRLSEQELPKVIASAYMLVYISYFEGFGIPVLEAIQSGVPVISSLNSPMQEVAKNSGIFVDPFSTDSIAHALKETHNKQVLRDELAGYTLADAEQFSWDKTADQVWKAISEFA